MKKSASIYKLIRLSPGFGSKMWSSSDLNLKISYLLLPFYVEAFYFIGSIDYQFRSGQISNNNKEEENKKYKHGQEKVL